MALFIDFGDLSTDPARATTAKPGLKVGGQELIELTNVEDGLVVGRVRYHVVRIPPDSDGS
jgi:hypothetical protein